MLEFSDLSHYEWLDIPVWVLDVAQARCLWANAAALGFWRADSEAELLARDMSDFGEADRPRLRVMAAEHARGAVLREPWTLRFKDEAVNTALVSRGILTAEGRQVMLMAASPLSSGFDKTALRDIQALKATQAGLELALLEAEAASQAKSSLLAQMSHEMRTPMNGVLSLTALVLQTELDARQRKLIAVTHDSAKDLMVIINDLLDMAKMDAGRIALEQLPFSLHDCLSDSTRALLPQAEERNISLQVRVQPAVQDALLGDALRLRQVLINLVGNALKFTERGEIRVEVELLEDLPADRATGARQRLRLGVHDTGIGMTREQAQQVFAPYSQADGSIARRYGGTGLGLSIAQRLVQLMGGDIQLETAPDVGSCFSFELVLQTQMRPPAAATPQPSSGQQHA